MIDVHNLSKSFGKLEVLKNIDVKVCEKEVVVLIRRQRFWKKYPASLFKLFRSGRARGDYH